jgi:hypothetical protein
MVSVLCCMTTEKSECGKGGAFLTQTEGTEL